jgi:hypothetical protein
VFLGSEALARGELTEYELRRWHRRIFRDVYVSRGDHVSLRDRIAGAWLRSGRRGIVAGVAASALHGASWVDDDIPIEMIWSTTRSPEGVVARDERVAEDEIIRINAVPATTRARTAFDLGRHSSRGEAIARLDALMWSSPFSPEDVLLLAKRYCGVRGVRRLREVLPLVDGGADSPRETWLRLLYVDAGLPRPTTQIPIFDGHKIIRTVDMGWEDFKVAAEYDGDQHRTNRKQYVKDLRVLPQLERLGWIVIRVINEDNPAEVLERTRSALLTRGWRG